MKPSHFMMCAFALTAAGCEIWQPFPSTQSELDEGLVVLYPGSLNSSSEMIGFYYGLRDAGLTEAIEVHHWALFLEHMIFVDGTAQRNRANAKAEALRLAEYKRLHPTAKVTLLGYSGGAVMCILVPQEMPPEFSIDRVIMLSPAVSRGTDLIPTLDRLTNGAVVYWSPRDLFTPSIAETLGLADASFGDPAATFGFDMEDPRLFQVEYSPEWKTYENYGEHVDYVLRPAWIRDVVAPWVEGMEP